MQLKFVKIISRLGGSMNKFISLLLVTIMVFQAPMFSATVSNDEKVSHLGVITSNLSSDELKDRPLSKNKEVNNTVEKKVASVKETKKEEGEVSTVAKKVEHFFGSINKLIERFMKSEIGKWLTSVSEAVIAVLTIVSLISSLRPRIEVAVQTNESDISVYKNNIIAPETNMEKK